MRDVVNAKKLELQQDKSEVKKLTLGEYKKLIRKVQHNKAQDINGMAIEHLLNCSDNTITRFKDFNDNITKDFDIYSNTFLSLLVSNFLYKGKNKPKEAPGSYRKITVRTTNQKITDTQMTEGTRIIAKNAQPGTQYGFTENTNHLLCSALKETLQTYAEDTKKPMICLTSDVSDAFSHMDRISQLYELRS